MECVFLTNAKYLSGFRVFLQFNNGISGEVDLEEIVLKHKIAEPLRDPQAFAQFHLDSWPSLAWECGFDIAPEALYERVLSVIKAKQ